MKPERRYCRQCMVKGIESPMKTKTRQLPLDDVIQFTHTYTCRRCNLLEITVKREDRRWIPMNKPKRQGTAFETELVKHFTGSGLTSQRLAEGGIADLGDLTVQQENWAQIQQEWVVEAKCTQTLPISSAFKKAKKKAYLHPVALIWKRMFKPKEGGVNRTSEIYVILDLETFTSLIGGEKQ